MNIVNMEVGLSNMLNEFDGEKIVQMSKVCEGVTLILTNLGRLIELEKTDQGYKWSSVNPVRDGVELSQEIS